MTGGAPSSPSLSGGRAGEGTGSGWMRKRPHALSLQAHLTQELSLISIAASSQGCSPALAVEPWQAGMGRPRSLPGIRKDRACQNSTAVMLLAAGHSDTCRCSGLFPTHPRGNSHSSHTAVSRGLAPSHS